MSWNYRIVKYANEDAYGLHEVYYADGIESTMTEMPVGFVGQSVDDLIAGLEMALKDAKERPVFYEPKDWATG